MTSTHVRTPDTAALLAYRASDGALAVLGPQTRASYLWPGDPDDCVGVRLRPGDGRAVLGVPVNELVDQVVRLEDLWGGEAAILAESLACAWAADDGEGVPAGPAAAGGLLRAAMDRRLTLRTPEEVTRAGTVRRAANLLTRHGQGVGEAARELGLSERHLRNLFVEGTGLPPKRFTRVHRVRSVLASANPWADLAAETGYYDQSHLAADFRDVMGVPPGRFRAGRLPEPRACEYSRSLALVGVPAGGS
ncbi:helix-turn-helix domain-containing protein [Nonomuraea sp. NBC_01738]|uniref:AraC family transcriptional regulator n=1 Tax=Nonomuraea sp. NBC_01738 TaxID=2976003 RepID=UPI002E0E7C34|nr:helix-turn-helix domain-containing protein [Nonomuraea sp. NBC_01738]